LLKRLSRENELVCIDLDPATEKYMREIREDALFVAGDGTSRLILENAGVADADAVIVTTAEEKVNIETAMVIKDHFDSKRVLAIGTSQSGVESLEALGAEVENIFTTSAVALRNRLIQASRAAHAIGLGKDEILEVEPGLGKAKKNVVAKMAANTFILPTNSFISFFHLTSILDRKYPIYWQIIL